MLLFRGIIKFEDFDFDNILIDERPYKNILIYGILYRTLISAGFIRVYNGTIILVLSGPENFDAIYNRIRYVISQTSGITYVVSHNYAKVKVD